MNNWPNDADGDVLRRLEADGFDFSKPRLIDFNVDFETWPPAAEAVRLLACEYPSAALVAPDEHGEGYIEFQVHAIPSYELVTGVQDNVSKLMAPFHGVCNSWGVWNSDELEF
jgi:hypothetical protein